MNLSDTDIIKFQSLYKSEFGMEISREDAYEKGIKLLRLMSITYKPMTQQEHDQVERHRKNTVTLLEQRINKNI